MCFVLGLKFFNSHLSVDYGCSYLLSSREHRSTTGLCVGYLISKRSSVSRPSVRISSGGELPSTSGPAPSEMFVLLKDLLSDLNQDISHHLAMHHSPSWEGQALGESVSDKGHKSDPAWDGQPSLVAR